MRVAYVAGPYRAPTAEGIAANIQTARAVAVELWRRGYATICPHLNTAHFDGLAPDELWLVGDLAIIDRLDPQKPDCVVMMEGWRKSAGARREWRRARRNGLAVYYWPNVPVLGLKAVQ